MQAERAARGGRGRRPGRERPGGDRDRDRDRERAGAAARGGGDGGGRRGRGRGPGFRGARRGRGGGAPRGGRRDLRGRGAGASSPAEDDSDADTYGDENEDQETYSKRKIVSNWDRYQDTEKGAENESGESQRGTDFSVLLSSAGDSFSQFRFAEEKEWDGEASSPKQNSALYLDCESLLQALQQLPLSLRLNVAAELVQATVPLELPQVKPKRNNDGQGLGMPLRGTLGSGGRGSASELKTPASPCVSLGREGSRPGPLAASAPQPAAADLLEEELDLLLNLDAPVRGGDDNIPPDETSQDLKPEPDATVAQEEEVPAKLSAVEEKNVGTEPPSAPPNSVTEEELEDWLDSMIA
ncbi:cell death regulator Aven [Tenrec ecaudatus]|uniref:cell death regulator Aven n=1 Tax=Tenrec ecaudatus TaxID=94439 RepID=UPI003F59204C